MKRVHVRVTGRVQGVFFRARTQAMAESLHLTGWVRNLADGSVEAVFEGHADDVATMAAWCGKGPTYAVIETISVTDEPYSGSFSQFSILY